jgi:DNA-binding protein Fis
LQQRIVTMDEPPSRTRDDGSAVRELIAMAARELVGKVSLTDAGQQLRAAMFVRAMSLSDGNRSRAARMLGVDRRYVARFFKHC